MSQEIVIIKIGTGVLTREQDGTLDEPSLVRLVTSISELVAVAQGCHTLTPHSILQPLLSLWGICHGYSTSD